MEFTYPRVEGYGCDKVCVLKTAQAFILVTHATILLSHPWNLLTLGGRLWLWQSLCVENSTGIYSGNTCHDLTLSSMEFTYPGVEGYGCDKVYMLKAAQAFISGNMP